MTSISHYLKELRSGHVSPVDIVEKSLDAAEKSQKSLNAFISISKDKARERAKLVQDQWSKFKNLPLAGVPIALKDNILQKDVRATCASKILGNFVAPYSSTVTQRLESAGAIVVGKTNMDEFAMGSSTEKSAFGPTMNPWKLDCVPGGSSGGSAAAVAGGVVPGAFGTDTGGSIRQPASFCGLVGIKPSYGRVSRYGIVAFGSSLDQAGPLARTVSDATLLLSVVAGFDPHDGTSSHSPVQAIASGKHPKYRIGVPEHLFSEGLDPDVKQGMDNALSVLKSAGHTIVSVELPHTRYGIAVYYLLATSEASSNLARFDGVRYGYRSVRSETLRDLYENTRVEGFGEEVKMRMMLGTFSLSSGYYDAYYSKATRVRRLIRNDFDQAYAKCDLIVTPTTPTPAFRLKEKTSNPLQMYMSDTFTVTVNLAGHCGMNVPVGLSKAGLPLGVQLIAPQFLEHRLAEAGEDLESGVSFQLKPSGFWGGI